MKIRPAGSNMTEVEIDGVTVLVSYSTPVAAFVPGQGVLRTEKWFSRTTSKHITKWINANFPTATQTTVAQADIEQIFDQAN